MLDDGRAQDIQLRTACDPCSSAKVRCDKSHPICGRCVQMKTQCCYTESRKHGKKALRKKLAMERTRRAIARRNQDHLATPASPADKSIGSAANNDWVPILAALSQPVVASKDIDSFLDDQQAKQLTSSSATSLWPFDQEFDTTNIDISTIDWDVAQFSTIQNGTNDELSLPGVSHSNSEPRTASVEDGGSPGSNLSSTHDCEAQAVLILRLLQNCELSDGATSCTTNLAHYDTLNLSPSFDRVIVANKIALDGWRKLMKCSCAQCPHLVLLYVSILSKMLFWYRIAAEKSLYPPSTKDDFGDSTTRNDLEIVLAVNDFDVRPTKVQIGGLSLDPDEQADLRCDLLIRELRKMAAAIRELRSVHSRTTGGDAHDIVKRGMRWSLTGISFVEEQLEETVQHIQKLR